MHRPHRGRQRPGKSQRILSGGAPALGPQILDALTQGAAVGDLEHQVRLLPGGLADVVDRDQVRAADAAQGAALGDEALPDLGVQAVVLSQDLDGHGGVESLVVCAVHRGEGADTEHLVQPVVAQQLCHQSFSGAGWSAPSRPASIARPRLTCDFTVPSARPSRAAIAA